jgi:hypothetical protein
MTEAPAPPAPPPGLRARLQAYHDHTRGAFTGFLMGVPLALTYALCLLLGPVTAEKRDFFIRLLISLLGERVYTGIQIGLAISFLALVFVLHRKGRFRPAYFGPLVVESMLYATALSAALWFGMQALGLRPAFPPPAADSFGFVVSALGEAINEETFFRWILLEALLLLGRKVGQLQPLVARGIGVAVGAAVYAAVGVYAVPLATNEVVSLAGPLVTLGLTGLVFGCLYYARGYPACAYTHVFYTSFWGGVVPFIGL